MAKFNTHGGYFAPKGYFRVDTGGSHEENPNGGVQIGVDPEGAPNMLEEGEPVYNDYVYSDNITADKEILKKYNIPISYAGKLYSVIADSFVDEAEERPLDPVSDNGLNAMLVRLADAQEEQKQIQEQKELEDELASLSPEELDELEQMLAQQEAVEAQQIQQEQMTPEEQMAMEQPMPMMANGGFIRKFAFGGDSDEDRIDKLIKAVEASNAAKIQAQQQARLNQEIFDAERIYKRRSRAAKRADDVVAQVENNIFNVEPHDLPAYKNTLLKVYDRARKNRERLNAARYTLDSLKMISPLNIDTSEDAEGFDISEQPVVEQSRQNLDSLLFNLEACGGKIKRYPDGGWMNFLNSLNEYSVSRNRGGTSGTYMIDTGFPLRQFKNIKELEDSEAYKAFTDYVLANPTNENVLNYLHALDSGTHKDVAKLFDADNNLVEGWEDLYRNRRYDQKGGIYHFNPESMDDVNEIILSGRDALPQVSDATRKVMARMVGGSVADEPAITSAGLIRDPQRESALKLKALEAGEDAENTGYVGYPTIGRYAGAAFNALTGLHNIFQEPDRYDFGHVTPTFVNGRLALQRQEYNPIDMQQAVNQWQANQNAAYRAISNSGYGASMPAVQLAAMYQGNQGYGNALTAARNYNNQHRANVIAQNNNAENAEANFYNRINAMNTNIANHNAWQNYRMAVQQDLYNKQAENAKWEAVSRALDASAIDLTNIGRENFAMNQINSNPANLGYGIDTRGIVDYLARLLKDRQNG